MEVKMNRAFSLFFGIGLILFGLLALGASLALPFFGITSNLWLLEKSWPIIPLGLGLLGAFAALVPSDKRGLGYLLIPASVLLPVGSILAVTNFFRAWYLWTYLWPVIVTGLGLGFLFTALRVRNVWLIIPAFLIGLNGVALQFCALTGLWEAWAVLWTVEPLSLGIGLALCGLVRKSAPLFIVGASFVAFAGISFLGLSVVLSAGWAVLRFAWPVLLITGGLFLLAWGLLFRPAPRLA
jgi:hypothetical protein